MFNIEELRSRPEPQRQYRFRMDPINIVYNADNKAVISLESIYVESITYSFDDIMADSVPFQNTYLKYAARRNNPSIIIDFYEDEFGTVQQALYLWRSIIRTSDGTYGYPSEYKRSIVLRLYPVWDNETPLVTIRMLGAFPSNANPVRLSYTDAGRVVVSQQFENEDIEIVQGGDLNALLTQSDIQSGGRVLR